MCKKGKRRNEKRVTQTGDERPLRVLAEYLFIISSPTKSG